MFIRSRESDTIVNVDRISQIRVVKDPDGYGKQYAVLAETPFYTYRGTVLMYLTDNYYDATRYLDHLEEKING